MRFPRSAFRAATLCLVATTLCSCNDLPGAVDNDTVSIDEFSTVPVTQAAGFRVQMQARVTLGLTLLSEAVQGGMATARVCLADACVERPLVAGGLGSACPGLPIVESNGTQLSVVRSSLDADVVQVDFCVVGLTEQRSFQTIVKRGTQSSNVVYTSCLPGPTCQSA